MTSLPDSRGWVRVPVERLPAGAGLPSAGYVVEPSPAGLLLEPRGATTRRARPVAAPLPPVTEHPDGPLLGLTGVAAGYGDLTLVDGLDLSVAAGDWVAVRGPSGSGKSTLLALAAGLLDPLAGTVAVGGTGWAGRDRGARAAQRGRWVALAPQQPGLVETMTVAENLTLAAGLRGARMPAAELTATAQALGLERVLDQPGRRAVRRGAAARGAGPGPGLARAAAAAGRADLAAGRGFGRAGGGRAARRGGAGPGAAGRLARPRAAGRRRDHGQPRPAVAVRGGR